MDIYSLNSRYGFNEELVFFEHPSGLVYAKVKTIHCTGEFFLQGAHVTRYQDLLFMSQQAIYAQGKALRGGIPICFPWFNSHPSDASLPAHGWARTATWDVLQTHRSSDEIQVVLGLAKDGFELVYRIGLGRQLKVALETRNTTHSALEYELALHTYFAVGNIDQVAITGDLQGCGYYDQLTKLQHEAQGSPIGFTQETDRIYYGQAPHIKIADRLLDRQIEIDSEGSRATVVWNPWVEKSKRMSDFGDLEYQQMCCIETANVRQRSVRLEAGETRTTSLCIKADANLDLAENHSAVAN